MKEKLLNLTKMTEAHTSISGAEYEGRSESETVFTLKLTLNIDLSACCIMKINLNKIPYNLLSLNL